MEIFNVDSKGVKRGLCLSCDLCPEFEWQRGAGSSSCSYCGCLPVKHFKCEELKEEVNEVNLVKDDSFVNDTIENATIQIITEDEVENCFPSTSSEVTENVAIAEFKKEKTAKITEIVNVFNIITLLYNVNNTE